MTRRDVIGGEEVEREVFNLCKERIVLKRPSVCNKGVKKAKRGKKVGKGEIKSFWKKGQEQKYHILGKNTPRDLVLVVSSGITFEVHFI